MSQLSGEEFGGALDNLRQVARVWLPRMATEYHKSASALGSARRLDERVIHRSDYFKVEPVVGYQSPQYFTEPGNMADHTVVNVSAPNDCIEKLIQLRSILEAAFGDCANNYAAVGEALGHAVDRFAAQDEAAAEELKILREDMEGISDENGLNDSNLAGSDNDNEMPENYYTEYDVQPVIDPRDREAN